MVATLIAPKHQLRTSTATAVASLQAPASVALVIGSGVTAAAFLPRGPVTGADVGWLMIAMVATGLAASLSIRSRWVLLVAPALHLLAYETARATVFVLPGPSFGRPRLDVTMGILLFLAMHVMYAVVTVVPMLLGVAVGRWWLAHHDGRTWSKAGLAVRWVVTLALLASTVLLAVELVRPGRVTPIRDSAGRPVAGSVAEQVLVRLGGVGQWVSIRGHNVNNPVLLHLSGGPGSSDIGWLRSFNAEIEEHFTVVVWEQRGAGKSYPALDPVSTFTLDRLVADGLELTAWLATRFDEQKIYLTGNSWGSTLGVLMAQQRPELFWAYVGTGQMVSQRATDTMLYEQLLDYADHTSNPALRRELEAFGRPPYRDVLGYAKVMEYYDVLEPYQRTPEFDRARGLSGFFPSEYSLLDTWNELRGFADMGGLLYPQLQGIDFRVSVPRLELPVYFVQGAHELSSRSVLADEWIADLQAPAKSRYVFENSGHNPDAEEAERFNDLMIETVLPQTYRP